jgi:hypothetical protein
MPTEPKKPEPNIPAPKPDVEPQETPEEIPMVEDLPPKNTPLK